MSTSICTAVTYLTFYIYKIMIKDVHVCMYVDIVTFICYSQCIKTLMMVIIAMVMIDS